MEYRIKDICEEKGITLKSIADSVPITLPALYNIANGKLSPKVETLEKIANALDVTLWQFFTSPESLKDDFKCPHCGNLLTVKIE